MKNVWDFESDIEVERRSIRFVILEYAIQCSQTRQLVIIFFVCTRAQLTSILKFDKSGLID
jgi:hypothetical protein